jgi:hypothetical protein
MESDLIGEAMNLALNLAFQERLDAADQPVTAAWLAEGVDVVPYDRPSGVDGEGFVTVGELRDRRDERTGFVLVQPETKALRIAWSNDFGN